MKTRRLSLIFDQLGKQAFPDDIDPWTPIQTRLATEQAMLRPNQATDISPRSRSHTRPLVYRIAFALFIIISIFMISPGRQALAETLRHLFRPASIPTLTTTQAQLPPFEYYVQSGDICLGIAASFNVSEQSLILLNNLSEDCSDLFVGKKLLIPQQTPTQIPPLEIYVESLDSCLSIAAAYDVSMQSIILLNNLSEDCSDLVVGRKLLIPQQTPTQLPLLVYKVQPLDICLGIAASFNVSEQSLILLNNLSEDCSDLFVGQKLLIPQQTQTQLPPLEYYVQPGDNCYTIAAGFGVEPRSIILLNKLSEDCSDLVVGRKLLIPQQNPELARPTFAPTFAVTLVSAQNQKPTETKVPLPTNLSPSLISSCVIDPYSYTCKISRAEKKAGFDAKEFPIDPEGFIFRAVEKAEPGEIWIRYNVIGGGGYLYWSQGIGEFSGLTGIVPENAIEEVQVGDNRGEYVVGDYFWNGQSSSRYVWNSCCRARLRWTDGERWYELDKQAALPQTDYMTRDVMIQMALQLVDKPNSAQNLRADYLTSLTEASQLVDFDIVVPSILPVGFLFDFASYDKDLSQLRLTYTPGGTGGAELGASGILIIETPLDKVSLDPSINGEGLKGEMVNINGYSGTYFSFDAYNHALTWRTSSLKITISVYSTKDIFGGSFTKEQVLEIGESIK